MVQIEAYGGQSVHSLGSCILHLHTNNKAFPTIFEVTNMTEPIVLSRAQAKAMGYVEFPKIKWQHFFTRYPTTSRKICTFKKSTRDYTQLLTQWLNRCHIQGTYRQKWINQGHTSKAIKIAFWTSNITDKMEYIFNRAQWEHTQTPRHQRLHVERKQWHFQGCRDPARMAIPHQTEGTVQASATHIQVSSSSHAICLQSRTK